jgi:hypothetical protein
MKYLEVRKVITNLMGRLERSRKIGVELTDMISDKHLQKGIAKIRRFRKNESDYFDVDAYIIKAELQGYFSWLGAPCSSGAQGHRS